MRTRSIATVGSLFSVALVAGCGGAGGEPSEPAGLRDYGVAPPEPAEVGDGEITILVRDADGEVGLECHESSPREPPVLAWDVTESGAESLRIDCGGTGDYQGHRMNRHFVFEADAATFGPGSYLLGPGTVVPDALVVVAALDGEGYFFLAGDEWSGELVVDENGGPGATLAGVLRVTWPEVTRIEADEPAGAEARAGAATISFRLTLP